MPRRRRRKVSLTMARMREWRTRRNYPVELLYGVVAKRLLNNVHMADLREVLAQTSTVVALDSPNVVTMNDLFRIRLVAQMLEEEVGGEIGFRADDGKLVDKKLGELAWISIVAYSKEKGKLLGELNMTTVNAVLRKLRKSKVLEGL